MAFSIFRFTIYDCIGPFGHWFICGRVALVATILTEGCSFGRDALGPLRPCGFASLRQPDAYGAGESCASAAPTVANGSIFTYPNAIVNRKLVGW